MIEDIGTPEWDWDIKCPGCLARVHKLEERIVAMGDLLVKAHYALGHITPDDGGAVFIEIDAFLRGKP